MINKWAWCRCLSEKRSLSDSIKDIYNEIVDFVYFPSLESGSDIMFSLGRLLGLLSGKNYISLPGDKKTLEKFAYRMFSYGCIRSRRHLINGKCPNK